MANVKRPEVLARTYAAALKRVQAREIPTVLLAAGHAIFRSVPAAYIPAPKIGGHVSKQQANEAMKPRDGATERGNRFSGPSGRLDIPASGGLYCVLQQQALVNEAMHYTGKGGESALADKCVLKLRLMGSMMVADLSPHNPGAASFLRSLGEQSWNQMTDGDDCSVARGIGLAVANSGYLRGLAVETVRTSERSAQERGDNLVLFGKEGQLIPGLFAEEAFFFGSSNKAQAFAVAFP
jgi:hypothetical protein